METESLDLDKLFEEWFALNYTALMHNTTAIHGAKAFKTYVADRIVKLCSDRIKQEPSPQPETSSSPGTTAS